MTAQVLFGGSFDPPHTGHLIIASEVLEETQADSLVFVPVARNPFKEHSTGASGQHRLQMLREMTAGDDRFIVSSHEVDMPPPSQTFTTVTALMEENLLSRDPWMIVGDELVDDLPRWYRSEDLLNTVGLAVVLRGQHAVQDVLSPDRELSEKLRSISPRFQIIHNPYIGISSRDIRHRLSEGRSVRYLVPDTVYEYIRHHSLYR